MTANHFNYRDILLDYRHFRDIWYDDILYLSYKGFLAQTSKQSRQSGVAYSRTIHHQHNQHWQPTRPACKVGRPVWYHNVCFSCLVYFMSMHLVTGTAKLSIKDTQHNNDKVRHSKVIMTWKLLWVTHEISPFCWMSRLLSQLFDLKITKLFSQEFIAYNKKLHLIQRKQKLFTFTCTAVNLKCFSYLMGRWCVF